MRRRPFYTNLYVQVLIGIACGIGLGYVAPARAAAMQPLGDAFIKLIKMLIAPIVFCTVVVGIAQTRAMKDVGRIGIRALIYFEAITTLALLVGLIVVKLLDPARGLAIDPGTLDVKSVAAYTT